MAVTVAELKNIVSLDLSQLRAGAAQAQAIMQGLSGQTTVGLNAMRTSATQTGSQIQSLSQQFSKFGTALSVGVTAPLILMGKAALTAGSSFESAFAGVRKTVDATEAQLAKMREGFRQLAVTIPISANEMAKIGEAAGALGIKTEDILSFTRTMADLGVATNLTSDQAATGLARLAKIIHNEAGPQYDRLGATLVALGNAGASTESEILEMSLRIAGAGKQAGLSESDILGFANALSSVGIEAEAGGSSMSRVFIKMADATKLGGKELQVFAQVAGQSAAQFKQSFERDAAGAAISFIEGLGRIAKEGKSLTPVLTELELGDIRVSDALRRAAGSGELFRESITLGSQAWKENTALTKEAAERYKTFESQVTLLKNQLTDIAITVFDKLRPALTGMLGTVRDAVKGFADLDTTTIKMGAGFLAVAGSAGPIALIIGQLVKLGPTGAVVAGVIAGSAAMAAAYAADIGGMQKIVADFFNQFQDGSDKMKAEVFTWGTVTDWFQLAFVNALDIALHKISQWMAALGTLGTVMVEGAKGNWTGVVAAWVSGTAEVERIDKEFAEHGERILKEKLAIERGGWQEHFRFLANTTGEAGRDTAKKFADEFTGYLNKQNPGMALQDALVKYKGPTIEAAKALGFESGKSALNSWRAGIEQRSPSGFEKDLDRIEKAFADFPGKISKSIAGLSAAGKQLLSEFRSAAKGIVDDLEQRIRDTQIGKLLHDVISPVIAEMNARLKELASTITIQAAPAMDRLMYATDLAGDEFEQMARKIIEASKKIKEVSSVASGAWKDIKVATETAAQTATTASDRFRGAFASISDFADKYLPKVVGMVIDLGKTVVTVIQSLGVSMPKIINDIFGALGKSGSATAQQTGKDIGGSMMGGISSSFSDPSGITAMYTAFLKGIEIFNAGFQDPSKMKRFMSGLSLGLGPALISLFFGGPSELQKAQLAAQMQQAKDAIVLSAQSVLKGAQEVIQASIESFSKAIDFFNKLDEFTGVRKEKFAVFFKNLNLLMDYFFELAQNWVSITLAHAKEVAEAVGPIADAIAALPLAFEGISKHMKVPHKQFTMFFEDFTRLMNKFFAMIEEWAEGQAKHAGKVAEQIAPVVNIFAPLIEAIRSMAGIEEPSNRAFHIVFRSLERFVERIAQMADLFDKSVLKAIQNFADKIAPATALWKDVTEAIKATVGIVPVTQAEVDAVVDGIVKFTNALIAGLEQIVNSDQLAKAVELSQAVIPIAAALKAWADAATSIRGYTAIAAEVWEQIVFDFERGLILLNLLILDAQMYVDKAKTFKDLIEKGAADIASAIGTYANSIASASSALGAGLPQGGTPVGGTTGATLGTLSRATSASGPISLTLNLSGDDPKARAVMKFIEETFGAGVLGSTSSQFA